MYNNSVPQMTIRFSPLLRTGLTLTLGGTCGTGGAGRLPASITIHASLWDHWSLVHKGRCFDSGGTPGRSSTGAGPLHTFFHALSAVKVLFSIDLRF